MVITLPTWLTLSRIAALVPLALLLWVDDPRASIAALVLFLAAAATDWLDGRLARTRGEVTRLGRCLDPIADKLLVATLLVMLLAAGQAPVVPVLVILLRELTISGLREALAGSAPALAVTPLAKWKTTAQMTALAVLVVGDHVPGGTTAGAALLWLAAALTAVTGVQYLKSALGQLADQPVKV
ncbi:MAG: CDP-diacylglycerol--glycerol-3-phosphate 3-phosphatidyltransferase [Alphaproteobacteria bacterium]